MAISVPKIFKERKYPFIFAFFVLLIFVTFVLITNSQSPILAATNLSDQEILTRENPSLSNTSLPGKNHSSEEIAPASDGLLSGESPSVSNSTFLEGDPFLTNATVENEIPFSPGSEDSPVSVASPTTESSNPNINGSSHTDPSSSSSSVTAVDDDGQVIDVEWELCKGPVATDYIPCLDNWSAIKRLQSRKHMEHRERHCPERAPRCLIPLPEGYKIPVPWPKSRDMIWYTNVPHPKLVEYKKDQHWVVKSGDYFIFPGGGTQFSNGVDYYINSLEETERDLQWGKKTRVILDVGCGVASFGGALLDRNVITMSFAPKDEHEAQIQFALERGIPATLSVIGTQKLVFPDNSFDMIHCARCRVHWHGDGGKPLLELNRVMRPGAYFVWSATPVYRDDERHKNVWKTMVALTESICWKIVAKTFFSASHIGLVIYQKPLSSSCYKNRKVNDPPLCDRPTKRNNSWYAPLERCITQLPRDSNKWPSPWPARLTDTPISLLHQPDAEEAFKKDTVHWSSLISEVYTGSLNVNWTSVRNVLDMNAGYGGFAAALIDQPLWVMNVVPIDQPDTLSIILDRGLLGMYHDWCESFNTYPRSYDLLHASFLFENLTNRCGMIETVTEMDRILRPGGYALIQDEADTLGKIIPALKSLHWSVSVIRDQYLVCKKGFWRPK